MKMGQLYLFSFLLTLLCVFSPVCAQTCGSVDNFPSVSQNTSISGSTFITINGTGMAKCAKECLRRSLCNSFNYNVNLRKCELNTNSSTSTVSPAGNVTSVDGVVSSDISTWPTPVAGPCELVNCPANSVCVAVNATSTTCTVECHDPVLPNGIINSEILHDVGATLDYTCDFGFVEAGQAVCLENGSWSYLYCEQGCTNPPTVTHAVLQETADVWLPGTVVNYTCQHPYVPYGEVSCRSNMQWTEMYCVPTVTTCANLLACNSTYGDGEYWLVPKAFTDKPVKIYCHSMSSAPVHFLTLPYDNYVDFADISCDPVYGTRILYTGCESVRYNKLQIQNITSMQTMNSGRKDYTFTNTSNNCYYVQYGNILDCHDHDQCNMADTRDYKIDTTGTGLIVDPNQQWSSQDLTTTYNDPLNITKSNSGREILVKCHQKCGWCYPIGDTYTFVLDPGFKPDITAAVVPICTSAYISSLP